MAIAGNQLLFSGGVDLIGTYLQGGIVTYVDPVDSTKGLVMALNNEPTTLQWLNTSYTNISTSDAMYYGSINTANIVANQGVGSYAAYNCTQRTDGGYTDWFLPSTDEIRTASANFDAVQAGLIANGGEEMQGFYHWSSVEVNQYNAKSYIITNGVYVGQGKTGSFRVRPFRVFQL
jgi:hypothetical protein